MRIDGVSEETDADGEVTSSFEYFRQPEEEFEVDTADIKPDVTDLSDETARNSALPALCFRACGVTGCASCCPRTAPAAGGAHKALAAPLGADQGDS